MEDEDKSLKKLLWVDTINRIIMEKKKGGVVESSPKGVKKPSEKKSGSLEDFLKQN